MLDNEVLNKKKSNDYQNIMGEESHQVQSTSPEVKEKKRQEHDEVQHSASDSYEAVATAQPESGGDGDSSKELQAKLDEMQDKYLRLMAEFDNYKKRMVREYQRMAELAAESMVQELINVRENFSRALRSCTTGNSSQFQDGMKLIFSQFDDVLKHNGLEEFCEAGDDFDPQLHDALLRVPHGEIPEGKIVEVHEKGYRLKGKVIRHAKVFVSAGMVAQEQMQRELATKEESTPTNTSSAETPG